MSHAQFGLALTLFLLGVPILIGAAGWLRSRSEKAVAAVPDWHLSWLSLLTYVLAFNLTFFIQELFLVVPKAFVPGLRPILYHNNHDWLGDSPLAELFQGTGALAILISGLLFAALARHSSARSSTTRLFFLWMAYNGLFQSLPQWAFAAVTPGNDTARALHYFHLSFAAQLLVGLLAVAMIVAAGLFMTRRFLELAEPQWTENARSRAAFVFRAAVIPTLLAIPVLIAFRVPREWDEVVIPTIAVPLVGLIWVQALSWRTEVTARPLSRSRELLWPAMLVLALLAVFQLVLRPGIRFY